MKHTEHFLTKWHDCDPDLIIRPSQVLMYMQECANKNVIKGTLSVARGGNNGRAVVVKKNGGSTAKVYPYVNNGSLKAVGGTIDYSEKSGSKDTAEYGDQDSEKQGQKQRGIYRFFLWNECPSSLSALRL